MVIIASEFAVTVTRLAATQQGVVIAANAWGKAKTIVQVAVLVLPDRDRRLAAVARPAGRRHRRASRSSAASTTSSACAGSCARPRRGAAAEAGSRPDQASRRRRVQPLAHRRVVRDVHAGASSSRSSPSTPKRSATTLCWWIVSRFSWRAETNVLSGRSPKRSTTPLDHLAHAVLDEAGAAVRLLDDGALVGALHQLVDLARHRALDDLQQRARPRSRCRSPRGSRCAACPRPRWLWVATGTWSKMRSISSSVKPSATSRSRARAGDELLRARARGHALRGDADDAAGAALGRDRAAEERVDLLRRDARHGRGLLLGVARGDRHLGAQRVLALAHELGDAPGELLGAERGLAEDDLADRVVDDLLEARHVRALLLGAEVDDALQLRREELLGARLADADDLLDAGHADARQAHMQGRAPAPGRRARRLGLRADASTQSCNLQIARNSPSVCASGIVLSLAPADGPSAETRGTRPSHIAAESRNCTQCLSRTAGRDEGRSVTGLPWTAAARTRVEH